MKNIGLVLLTMLCATAAYAGDTIEDYIREYPNQEQAKMMNTWLAENNKGEFHFTGLVDPTDGTVVTPQATVDYGYNWFSVSDAPAILSVPTYDKFFSVSIFDMEHNVPAVIVNPSKPILIRRPNQEIPDGDFTVVTLETDQGLALTRMVVIDNMKEVRALSKSITMEGGRGDMTRNVQRFSPQIEASGLAIIKASLAHLNPDIAFGNQSGDVGDITLAGAVMIGQLGTPADTVRYGTVLADEFGQPFTADGTYTLTVPPGIAEESGYYSITVYGADNKLLIPNEQKIYDRTTYSSEPNEDGSYTVTLSPDGSGVNGIPTGKPFYAILRAYVPVSGTDMTVKVTNE